MNQENDQEDMRPEYDIRGGVRGKYFSRYIEVQLRFYESPWIRPETTESRGLHASESTIRIEPKPVYQIPRIEIGTPAVR